jgi:large subunit ribosomal protein L18
MRTLTTRLKRRKDRVSKNVVGTAVRPRVSIFRSNKYIYAQVIDDAAARTLCAVDSREMEKGSVTKKDSSLKAGEALGKKLQEIKIQTVIIDRSRFHYQGRVQSLVEGIRSQGIQV